VLRRLKASGWLSSNLAQLDDVALVDAAIENEGPLNGARVTDLIEFGRIAHAEMAAICTTTGHNTARIDPLHDDLSVSRMRPPDHRRRHRSSRLHRAVYQVAGEDALQRPRKSHSGRRSQDG
jgi:hypothetical protein